MLRYREKLIPIEAVQFFPGEGPWPEGVEERLGSEVVRCHGDPDVIVAAIETPKGQYVARPGDWIIKNCKGEVYPYPHGRFEAIFDRVEDE